MNTSSDNYFSQLSSVNVIGYVEKKGQFSYLSWPFAVSQLRQFDPQATWEVKRFNGLPYLNSDAGVFVEVAVTVRGVTLSQIHPVLDSRNRPILAPTSFDVDTSLQRCLVKAIALHGLGLNIYAGEDLPIVEGSDDGEPQAASHSNVAAMPQRENGVARSSDSVTSSQVNYIRRLLTETGAEMQRILDHCSVARLEDIPKSQASRVIQSLEQLRNGRSAA